MTKRPRRAIPKGVRFEIFKRDKFACMYCGRTPPGVLLHIDHVRPLADGGTDDPENLITACLDCNIGKAAKSLEDVPKPLVELIEEREERAAQVRAFNDLLMELRAEEELIIEQIGRYWFNSFVPADQIDRWSFAPVAQRNIRMFLRTIAPAEMLEAIDTAMRNVPARFDPPNFFSDTGTWKYFCGICWRITRERGGGRAQ